MSIDFAAMLTRMVEESARRMSTVSRSFAPALRVRGRITPLDDQPVLNPQDPREIVYSILNDEQRKAFENNKQRTSPTRFPMWPLPRQLLLSAGLDLRGFRLIPQEI